MNVDCDFCNPVPNLAKFIIKINLKNNNLTIFNFLKFTVSKNGKNNQIEKKCFIVFPVNFF